MAVTVTDGTTAPEGSVMVPWIEPNPWPKRAGVNSPQSKSVNNAHTREVPKLVSKASLDMIPPDHRGVSFCRPKCDIWHLPSPPSAVIIQNKSINSSCSSKEILQYY